MGAWLDSPLRGYSDPVDDDVDLRRYVRDLVALSTLPAMWVGEPPQGIVDSVADALVGTLPADFVYVRLEATSDTGEPVETCKKVGSLEGYDPREIGQSITRGLRSLERVRALSIPNPFGAGTVCVAVVPIGAGNTLGLIGASAERTDFPSRYDLLLMNVVANHAAIALQTAQLRVVQDQLAEQRRVEELLEHRVVERTRYLESLYRADETLHRSLRLEDVLQALVDVSVDVLGVDQATVQTYDGQQVVVRAARGFDLDAVRRLTRAADGGFSELVFRSGEAVDVPEYAADPRASPRMVELARALGVHALMCVPIVARGEVFAVFNVYYATRHAFGEGERRLFVALAQRAGLAIENARLYEAARGKAALDERQKLARDLHDSLSQGLYAIALNAASAAELLPPGPSQLRNLVADVVRLADAGLAEMRALIFELRPESLESVGLAAAIEKQVAAIQARHNLLVQAKLDLEPDLPLATKEAVYRIVQEALHNIARHARARTVELVLEERVAQLEVRISDDGKGFDPSATFAGHLGLRSMRERAAAVGGTLDIHSTPGHGTRVTLHVPVTASG